MSKDDYHIYDDSDTTGTVEVSMSRLRKRLVISMWCTICFAVLFIFIMGAEYQRQNLGAFQGDVLLLFEMILLGGIAWARNAYDRGNRVFARRIAVMSFAAVMAAIGWLISPSRVYDRSAAREFEANQRVIYYNRSQELLYGEERPDPPKEQQRVRALFALEARAARLELRATEVRYLTARQYGSYATNDLLSYSFYILAACLVTYAWQFRKPGD